MQLQSTPFFQTDSPAASTCLPKKWIRGTWSWIGVKRRRVGPSVLSIFFAILRRYFFVQLRSHENEKKMCASVNQMLVTFGEKTLKKIMPRKIWGEKKVWSKYFKWSKLGLDEEKGSNFFLSKFSKVWLDLFIKFTLTRSFSLSSGLKTPSSGFKILPNVSILYEPRYHSLSSFFPPHYNGEKKGKKKVRIKK